MKTVAFCTLGCKVNQYETNAMMQKMIEAGYEVVDFETKADIYIINTCTVTNMADKKSRQMLRRVKEINPEAILVAVGCYAQVAKEKLEQIPEIDLILGINEKNDIVEYVEQASKNTYVSDVLHQTEFLDFGDVTYTEKTRAVIKVQDGCNQFCSYCIIPYARGRIRSRKPESVIKEITDVAKEGIKEVVITGIHIASYGKDFDIVPEYRLIDLLEEIQKVDGIQRIRLGSLEPTLITEEFVTRLKKLSKICDHFHLSLQSGCDETLKRMNRKSNGESIRKLIIKLRKEIPDVIIRTTVMVGFPGETQEDFEELYEFLKEAKFDKLGAFTYSKEEGTAAEKMPNQVHPSTKRNRYNKVMKLQQEISKKNLENKIETIQKVRIEGMTNNKKYYVGRSYMDVPEIDGLIYIENTKALNLGEWINCKIIGIKEYDMIGKIN